MIEILCTVAGIIAGVAAVGTLFRADGSLRRFQPQDPEQEPERIKEIANQLRLISERVAANVSAHNDKVEHFSDQLGDVEREPSVVFAAIEEIIEANRVMQAELANAQKRIAEQSEMIEQATHQARTDALTGLANRRALDEHLTKIIEYSSADEAVGLLFMDIDHFKNFNDSFGHTTGDAVLASFAKSLIKCCGTESYIARYGGEEFAVVLAADSVEDLVERSADIRRYVSEQVISYEDLQLNVTASAGVCVLLSDDTRNSAYERADEGLYKSKAAGRNCGHWLSPEGWLPFPEVATQPVEESTIATTLTHSSAETNPPGEGKTIEPLPVEPALQTAQDPLLQEADDNAFLRSSPTVEADDRAEILDLQSFFDRLELGLEQLQRADMPGTGLMIEAVGLSDAESQGWMRSWDEVVRLIQLNLRGIDVVCQYRFNTLCVFLSGCSQNVAIDRAALIQASLADARATWVASECPDRFAIAVASVAANENCSQFLNRLEAALDDAQDASESQVVVDDGESRHFQEV